MNLYHISNSGHIDNDIIHVLEKEPEDGYQTYGI